MENSEDVSESMDLCLLTHGSLTYLFLPSSKGKL
jgi:hypothetical protein